MISILNNILNNRLLLVTGAWVGAIFTVVLIVLFFVKSSRDERGRAIIGKASIVSTIVFIILVNVVAKITSHLVIDYLTMANCIQWIYNIVVIVESCLIIILKKIS